MKLRGELAIILISMLGLMHGCSSNSGGPSSSAGNVTISGENSSVILAEHLKPINEALNASPSYVLESSDVALLEANGLLSEGDQAALNQLLKN